MDEYIHRYSGQQIDDAVEAVIEGSATADAAYLSLTGGTLTGSLIVDGKGKAVAHQWEDTDGVAYKGIFQVASISDGTRALDLYYTADNTRQNRIRLLSDKTIVARRLETSDGDQYALTSDMSPAMATVTALTVTGVAMDNLYAYTIGKMAYVRAQITISEGGVYTSWKNIASGLPAPLRTVYDQCAARSSAFSRALDLNVTTDGYLRISYGANNGWMYYVNICYPIA